MEHFPPGLGPPNEGHNRSYIAESNRPRDEEPAEGHSQTTTPASAWAAFPLNTSFTSDDSEKEKQKLNIDDLLESKSEPLEPRFAVSDITVQDAIKSIHALRSFPPSMQEVRNSIIIRLFIHCF